LEIFWIVLANISPHAIILRTIVCEVKSRRIFGLALITLSIFTIDTGGAELERRP
jgi:hypothetical protein